MLAGTPDQNAARSAGDWVDDYLLAGPDRDVCLLLDRPITRGELTALVARRTADLADVGLRPGGTVCLRVPPGLAYVVSLLAAWRLGAQVSLLDHRLTTHEVDRALARIRPQLVVSAASSRGPLRGHSDVTPVTTGYDGEAATTSHALLQLSSGSTGPSKVIGRTAADLRAEIERYQRIEGTPRQGERVVLLASMVHVLGLVGGLLYGLRTGVQIVVPRSISTDAILAAVAAGPEPTTVIGVPFQIGFLTGASATLPLPQLTRMTVGGELVRASARQAFMDRYQVPLGNMYGMTEVGVIATDLFGEHRPALSPAPGMSVREEAGQLLISAPASPYVGLTDPSRWIDGWLYTKDAGTVHPDSGLLTVRGRLDSQVSVGGLKVDLTEVEQTLAGLPGVAEVIVAHDGAIEAFLTLDTSDAAPAIRDAMAELLAPYKRPRSVHIVDGLPRTATGKLIRSVPELRRVAAEAKRRRAAPEPVSQDLSSHSPAEERNRADVR